MKKIICLLLPLLINQHVYAFAIDYWIGGTRDNRSASVSITNNDLRSKWYSEVKVPQSANQVSIDISSLDNVDASQFDKTFLDLAAKHHRSGVEKLGKMMPNIDRRATHHLAVKIIKKEGSDVARIESLQKTIK